MSKLHEALRGDDRLFYPRGVRVDASDNAIQRAEVILFTCHFHGLAVASPLERVEMIARIAKILADYAKADAAAWNPKIPGPKAP